MGTSEKRLRMRRRRVNAFRKNHHFLAMGMSQVSGFLKKLSKRKVSKGGAIAVLGAACLAVTGVIVFSLSGKMNNGDVYAASAAAVAAQKSQEAPVIPTGLAGVISGVIRTEEPSGPVHRIGTSCEMVLVGQRTLEVREEVGGFDMSGSMVAAVDALSSESVSKAQNATMMSDTDYQTLLRIVEAEAGGEDLKGKVLVANVIMNRVRNHNFPDNITDVVWDNSGGAPQFAPTYDGRIGTVTVSDETREAVKMALEGTDYSQGALFFVAKDLADKDSVSWFDDDLEHLFEHGVHDFYTFPDPEKAKLEER